MPGNLIGKKMNLFRRKKMTWIFTLLLGSLLLLGWIGSRAATRMGSRDAGFYGGRIPQRIRILIHQFQEDLQQADRILMARPNALIFQDQEGDEHKYRFQYGALWKDDYPVIARIKSFHFEFRDGRGNLLNSSSSPHEIVTIGYVLHFENQGKNVLANLSVRLSNQNRDWTRQIKTGVSMAQLD